VRFWRDTSPSTITAGFVAMLVGYTSSVAIVFSAARAFGANDAEVTSWVWAVSIGMGLITIGLSLRWRIPTMVAWSTPGAAVLATAAPGQFTMGQAIGTFIVCGLAIAVIGFTGWFEKAMSRIPLALAGALLAGALTHFAIDGFAAASSRTGMIVAMFAAYLVGRRFIVRYTMMFTLAVGVTVAAATGSFHTTALRFSLAHPVFTRPSFSLPAIVSLGVPLFVVTMAGQNLPGVAALKTFDYPVPLSTTIGITGLGTMAIAPFGGYMLNLSAITAAICMSPESHEDKSRRYTAAVWNGIFYVIVGLFATAVTGLLNAFPKELVKAVAALALLMTIANNLANATYEESTREAAIVTFLVTVSGVTLARVGSAFWGAVAGIVALLVLRKRSTI
jgi:benzoate membrane transport protein